MYTLLTGLKVILISYVSQIHKKKDCSRFLPMDLIKETRLVYSGQIDVCPPINADQIQDITVPLILGPLVICLHNLFMFRSAPTNLPNYH